jgi:hypothetical protein
MSRRALPKKISTRSLKPVVEGVEKRILLATFTVTNTTDTVASGSLRWAIGQSNAAPGSNTINFAIPGAGVQTIAITSALPTITVPVTIDGTTEPGYSSTPLIELNGSGAGSSVDGLDISAGGSTVKGLAINRFTGEGISLSVAGGNLIENDFIGTNPGGTLAEGNSKDGVLVQVNSNGNVIKDNLISGNTANGIYLNGQLFGATNPVTSGNLVIGNLLGTDINGTATLQNHEDGIAVQNAPLSTIGGTTAAARNIVSGNGAGMELFDNSDGTVIEGNYIGTDITGEIALGNNGSNGFFKDDMVFRGISNSTIGGTVAGAGNVISGSSNNGIDCFVIGSENQGPGQCGERDLHRRPDRRDDRRNGRGCPERDLRQRRRRNHHLRQRSGPDDPGELHRDRHHRHGPPGQRWRRDQRDLPRNHHRRTRHRRGQRHRQ